MSSQQHSNLAPKAPLQTTILNTLQLRFMQTLIHILSYFQKSTHPPTLLKNLHPSLPPARIFFPPSSSTTSSSTPKKLLPTLFSLHGGGFCLGSPSDDDHINTALSQSGILIISLPYPLSPRTIYPHALTLISSQILTAISSADLPIDVSRIGILGFSAGGNLALAVQQMEGMPAIKTTIAFYPPVDFTRSVSERLDTRVSTAREEKDWLAPLIPMFFWGYVAPGTQLDDPKLSPFYASRKALSEWLFVVGCERDLLCMEAGEMVAGWVGEEWGDEGRDEMKGEEGKVRWFMVRGQRHAYTHDLPGVTRGETREGREGRKRVDREVWEMVSAWLMEGPFKK